jgi:hypothetical protein
MTTATPVTPVIALVSGERFFLKEVALDPSVSAAGQVELALEESSPFPLAQLYHGFVVSADRRQALGYAAYRRRFSGEETAEWPEAAVVLPEFLALIGAPPPRPLIVVHVDTDGVNGAAWNGQTGLPVTVVARSFPEVTEAHVTDVTDELRRRAGLDAGVEVRRLEGPVGAGSDGEGEAVFRIAGEETARLSAEAVIEADVRDKSFLEAKRREDAKRRSWAWALAGAVSLLLLALALDLGAVGLNLWARRQREQVLGQADEVRRIETAQTLATRIEDLTERQERPLEWLSRVSAVRPRSVQFLRVVSNNDRTLTINAQTPDAAAVGAFETVLRQRTDLEQVEMRDLRSREGLTSFVLAVRFKPEASGATGGQP